MIPAGTLPPQDWLRAEETRAVLAALTAEGGEARFVGGCVRDAVLGRPVHDIDIATPEPPDRVMALLEAAGVHAVPTGIDHGTVTAVIGSAYFEVTTLRLDVETYGRHAQVRYTDDWLIDAARRDFTINTLYCDLEGQIYDPHGGLADLRAGCVRFVGAAEARIREDVLRLLRFFRFRAHYGVGEPDPEGLAACTRLAPLLDGLSGERVAGEMLRLLEALDPAAEIARMIEAGVIARLLPGTVRLNRLRALVGVEAGLGEVDPLRRLGALLAPETAEAVASRLVLSNAESVRLARMNAPAAQVDGALDPAVQRLLIYRLGTETFRDLVLLAWADAMEDGAASNEPNWPAMLDLAGRWTPPVLPVRGRDALALGLAPGPAVGEALSRVEVWWMERDFAPERPAALAKLKEIVATLADGAGKG
ncbi:MAG: CCA tRNA nucleotidyltransferase [Rhodospirillaceae bacterium]|nr:CCA tRNA nucleotidyltransferase [Rhodospirillaceae bacterium]MBT6116253.1 CCA tRNA nucleotidyltransferase [Rhodospirillaceae bacterium]